ncbi:hypothetical protein GW796_07135 [archaeon]|nr:hypothetical protein [archaeon]
MGEEVVNGKFLLKNIGKAISIFGGSKAKIDSWEYINSYKLANALAKKDISVISGGGTGVMEAANRGAKDAEHEIAKSIGLNINILAEKTIENIKTLVFTLNTFLKEK